VEKFPELKNHHGEVKMDPVANMLVSVKNGYLAKKTQVSVPFSAITVWVFPSKLFFRK